MELAQHFIMSRYLLHTEHFVVVEFHKDMAVTTNSTEVIRNLGNMNHWLIR